MRNKYKSSTRPIVRETWAPPTETYNTCIMKIVFPDGKVGNLTCRANANGAHEIILDRLDRGIKITVARRSDASVDDVHTYTT